MRTCPECQRTFSDETDFCPRDGTPLRLSRTPTEAELDAGLARRYRVIRRLGAGGMGTVFLAEQIAVGNRPVALKVLLRKLLDDPEFLMRFHNEAASTGKIHHPNVVTIYESGQADDGTPYIAMEYLEGQTLRDMLQARGALPLPDALEIIQQVARGLGAAHKLGIIHRDLKPDNIFLTHGDEGELVVKVMDFGIAKLRESASHTLAGTVLGTPAYMSFEQASGMRSDELDARSDIYSLGVVVYEMLTGRVPFHSDTPLGYVRKHLTEQPPPFHAVKPDLPTLPEVERAVLKALRKERDERWTSATDFAKELAEAAQAMSLPTTKVVAPPRPVPEPRAARPAPATAAPEAQLAVKTPPQPAPSPVAVTPQRPAVVKAPQLRPAPIKPAQTRPLLLAALAVLILGGVGGLWYYSTRRPTVPAHVAATTGSTKALPSVPENMVYIPGGSFTMGRSDASDPEETPAHVATVASFYIDKTPVTNAQFAVFVDEEGTPPPPQWPAIHPRISEENWPVTEVTCHEAQAYCGWRGGRLPSEAEWEFAARGPHGRLYPWGNEFKLNLANSIEQGLGKPEPVGIRPNNASLFGVLDMSGNVWEWTADDYKPYPGHTPTFEIPVGAKVIRGGSFKSDRDHVTTTTRNLEVPNKRSPTIGFRCAR